MRGRAIGAAADVFGLVFGIAGAPSSIAHFARVGGMRDAATLLLHGMRATREQWLD
ncbi:hypothetical protein PQR02_31380 [Paraburkholderia sediminicola]|uniref:Uncharacterized protein n=1 Tax=Paraburkholderia rhynchosiae TaxID=487049 RepID=A0ACC7NIY4_9BURK